MPFILLQPTSTDLLFCHIGGSWDTFFHDLDQSGRMWKLRVKIDSWSKGIVDEDIRQRNRDLLIDEYLRLPPRRVWMFLSACRFFILGTPSGREDERVKVDIDGPESTIAKGRTPIRLHEVEVVAVILMEITACHVVEPNKLSRLMYLTGMNDISMKQQPSIDIWGVVTRDARGVNVLVLLKKVAFTDPGES